MLDPAGAAFLWALGRLSHEIVGGSRRDQVLIAWEMAMSCVALSPQLVPLAITGRAQLVTAR
jgi:hypothetical protein